MKNLEEEFPDLGAEIDPKKAKKTAVVVEKQPEEISMVGPSKKFINSNKVKINIFFLNKKLIFFFIFSKDFRSFFF